jgi:hypothetical protein
MNGYQLMNDIPLRGQLSKSRLNREVKIALQPLNGKKAPK